MSKRPTVVYRLISAIIFSSQLVQVAASQTLHAHIEVRDGDRVAVTGRFDAAERRLNPRSLAFERRNPDSITNLELFDAAENPVKFRRLMEGEFLADRDFAKWSYTLALEPLKDRASAAHYSWLRDGTGIVMARDVVPLGAASGEICVIASGQRSCSGPGSDPRDLVVPVGNGWTTTKVDSASVLSISGTWKFTADDVVEMAGQIYQQHAHVFQHRAPLQRIILANFPVPVSPGSWEAETRGDTVTIISSDMPFRTQSLQRLHEQLRHELFHLWIPNGVNLTGNYDWFFEGFALYRSLKLAVGLNRIRFEDFLDTLSRAYTIDGAQSQRSSLVQASATRFAGSNTQVYARGMLVAFLCDLVLLSSKRGSVENLLREVYAKHGKSAAPVDGNAAVTAILRSNPDLVPIVERYVTGSEKLEWTNYISLAGIEDADPGILTSLRVKAKPGGRQKALLDKLGYNNWRKLSPNSR